MVSAGGAGAGAGGAGIPRGLAQGRGGCVHTRRQPGTPGADICFICLRAGCTQPPPAQGQWRRRGGRSRRLDSGPTAGPGFRLRITVGSAQGCVNPAMRRVQSPGVLARLRSTSAEQGVLPSGPRPGRSPLSCAPVASRPCPGPSLSAEAGSPQPAEAPLFSLWDPLSSAIHSDMGGRAAAGLGPGDPRAPAPPWCPGQPGALRGLGSAERVKAGPRGQPGTATTPRHPQARAIRPHAGLCRLAVLLPTPYQAPSPAALEARAWLDQPP